MIKYALFARLEARPGKEQEVADFLHAGLAMANGFSMLIGIPAGALLFGVLAFYFTASAAAWSAPSGISP